MSNGRRHFMAEQKAAIVRRHLSGKELADEFGVQPSQIHLWVKQVLEVAERAFERSSGQRKGEGAKDRKIGHLEFVVLRWPDRFQTPRQIIAKESPPPPQKT